MWTTQLMRSSTTALLKQGTCPTIVQVRINTPATKAGRTELETTTDALILSGAAGDA